MVSTLSRMYRDSEMVIWFTSGPRTGGPARARCCALPGRSMAVHCRARAGGLALGQPADPATCKTRYEQRSDIDRIAPGEFQESSNGDRVFFIDKDTPDNMVGQQRLHLRPTEKGNVSPSPRRSTGRMEVQGRLSAFPAAEQWAAARKHHATTSHAQDQRV